MIIKNDNCKNCGNKIVLISGWEHSPMPVMKNKKGKDCFLPEPKQEGTK